MSSAGDCGLSCLEEGGFMTRRWASSSCPLAVCLVFVVSLLSLASGINTSNLDVEGGEKEIGKLSGRFLNWYPLQAPHRTRRSEDPPIQLCGYRLLEAVRALCHGNFVGFSRRSDPDMEDHRVTWLRMERLSNTARHPHVTNQKEHQQLHFRFRRNIIDDCCMRPCTVTEMLKYCGR